jgi:hypothetical protein
MKKLIIIMFVLYCIISNTNNALALKECDNSKSCNEAFSSHTKNFVKQYEKKAKILNHYTEELPEQYKINEIPPHLFAILFVIGITAITIFCCYAATLLI